MTDTMMTTYPMHPACSAWPRMDDDRLMELAEDIRANGLLHPIVLTPDNILLDGRNRDLACQIAGVVPHTVVYEGDDYVDYVISANKHRRQLTDAQWAAVGAELDAVPNGTNRYSRRSSELYLKKTLADIGKDFGLHEKTILTARRVKNKSPVMFEMIKEGKLGVNEAANALRVEGKDQSTWASPEEVKVASRALRKERGYDDARRPQSRSDRRETTVRIVQPTRPIGTTPHLSPKDVDPEFTGTATEFVDKYGHVQTVTAAQFANMRFSDLVSNMRALMKSERGLPECKPIDLNWLRNPSDRDVAKLTEALEHLRPKMAKAEAALAAAVDALRKKRK